MDKPVITLNAISKDLYWKNITDASQLCDAYDDVFTNKEIADLRKWVADQSDAVLNPRPQPPRPPKPPKTPPDTCITLLQGSTP